MIFHVDANNGIPIYEQIVRQVKFAVAAGHLDAADHVPSVRELATQVAVNANTVARAYRDLQTEGILRPIRGTGLAVTAEAPKLCRSARQQLVRERLRHTLEEAVSSGLTEGEIRSLVEKELTKVV
ncbi:MAG: GntR family transcriptional regulator [Planctomycetaceae bacterium]